MHIVSRNFYHACVDFYCNSPFCIYRKGVGKNFRAQLTMQTFRMALQSLQKIKVSQYSIRAKNHKVSLQRLTKVALTSFDNKMYLMPCGVHAYAYGNVNIVRDLHLGICSFCQRTTT